MRDRKTNRITKRNRPKLTCTNCYKRKVRCDRGHPCSSCVAGNIDHLCIYEFSTCKQKVPSNNSTDVSKMNTHDEARVFCRNQDLSPIMDSETSDFSKKNGPSKESSIVRELEDEASSICLIQKSEFDLLRKKMEDMENSLIMLCKSESTKLGLGNFKALSVDKVLSEKAISPKGQINEIRSKIYCNEEIHKFSNRCILHNSNLPGCIPKCYCCPISNNYLGFISPVTTKELSLHNMNMLSLYDKFTGINPYDSQEETINFYKDYIPIHETGPSRRINDGPFTWSSLLKKDRGLSLLRQYTRNQRARRSVESSTRVNIAHTKQIGDNSNFKEEGKNEENFEKRTMELDGDVDMVRYKSSSENKKIKSELTNRNFINKLNENTIFLGLTLLDRQLDRELQIIEKIKIILPTQKAIWLLIKRFFYSVYPFMPFIDQSSFQADIERIIGVENYEDSKISKLNIEKRLDLANIGILLIILRLSYLSYFSNDTSTNEDNMTTIHVSQKLQDIKYLLNNPIDMDIIDVAQLCLHQFQLLRKTNLSVLQCALYLRIYNKLAPEEGDGADGGDSQVVNSMLIQMAYSIGLNREPDNFDENFADERVNHLGRKIWYYLIISDFTQSYTFGNPLNTSTMYYDTKLPFNETRNEKFVKTDLEKGITEFYKFCEVLNKGPIKEILNLSLNIGDNVKVSDVTNYLNRLEIYTLDLFGSLKHYLEPLELQNDIYSFHKTLKVKILLSLKTFYLTLYFHLYIYYEKKANFCLSFFYLKKMLTITILEIMPYIFPLIFNSETYFGEGVNLIINPVIEMIIHRANEINIAIITKVNFTLHNMRKSLDHDSKIIANKSYKSTFDKLGHLSECFEECLRLYISAISKLSNRYYYAWVVSKSHSFRLKIITSDDLYAQDNDFNMGLNGFSSEQVHTLTDLCKASLESTRDKLLRTCRANIHHCSMKTNIKSAAEKSDSSLDMGYTTLKDVLMDTNYSNLDQIRNSSSNSTLLDEFKDSSLNNDQIDSIWLQMASIKSTEQDNVFNRYGSLAPMNFNNDNSQSINGPANHDFVTQNFSENQMNNYEGQLVNLDLEYFDMFSDLPLEQLLNLQNPHYK